MMTSCNWSRSKLPQVESDGATSDISVGSTLRGETLHHFEGLDIEGDVFGRKDVPGPTYRESPNSEGIKVDSEDEYEDDNAMLHLNDFVIMYPNKKLTKHGNVYQGDVISGVTGARECAIKFARESEQNIREARIIRKLGYHRHVIDLIQSGTYETFTGDCVFLALEKCHSLNLREYLLYKKGTEDKYDTKWGFDCCRQIINGLEFVHKKLVIHKDLKPSNILMTLDRRALKIADFGSSQEVEDFNSMIYNPYMSGTLGYRSPESYGGSYVSLKTDIFSLGVLFYFILSNGKSPFGPYDDLWEHNTIQGVIDTAGLTVYNPVTTEHLIKATLRYERRCRPSIWEVARHPCWSEEECCCDSDYQFEEEVDDGTVTVNDVTEESYESETELEREREALKILEVMLQRPEEEYLVIFEKLTKHLQRVNPRTNKVEQIHELNDVMKENLYAPVNLGRYIYALLIDRTFYRLEYNRRNAKWEKLADAVFDQGWFPPLVAAKDAIYVVSRSTENVTKVVSRYNPKLNRWERVTDKKLATRDFALASLGNHVFCLGGWIDGVGASKRVERLNTKTLIWDEVKPMRIARYYCAAVVHAEHIYLLGGRKMTSELINSVEKFDTVTQQWTTVTPMRHTRSGSWFRCHIVGRNIFAVGGDYDETIEMYDVNRDEWRVLEIAGPQMDIDSSVALKMTT